MISEKKSITTARLGAVQLIYQMKTNDVSATVALASKDDYFSGKDLDGVNLVPADLELLEKIVLGYERRQEEIDSLIGENSKYDLNRLELILQCILKAAIYELLENKEDYTTAKIISAYLDITNSFYDKKEVGIINVILDKIANSL